MKRFICLFLLFLSICLLSLACSDDDSHNISDSGTDSQNNNNDIENNDPECPPDPSMTTQESYSSICMDFSPRYDSAKGYTYCEVETTYPESYTECPQGTTYLRDDNGRKVCSIPQLYGLTTGWYYLPPSGGVNPCPEHGDISFPLSVKPPQGSSVYICCKAE